MLKYREPIILFGAFICLVEFIASQTDDIEGYTTLIQSLHLTASFILLVALVLYVSTWRWGWVLFLRVLFACFIALMMIYSFNLGSGLFM